MKLALYETVPGKSHKEKSGIMYVNLDSTRVTVYPSTLEGLTDALESAKTSDAQIVKLDKEYYDSEKLLKAVQKLIKQGYGKKLFMPAIGIERELIG